MIDTTMLATAAETLDTKHFCYEDYRVSLSPIKYTTSALLFNLEPIPSDVALWVFSRAGDNCIFSIQ